MELVQVRIKVTVVTAQYGALECGDILRTTSAFAKHLVDDCKAAEYLDAPMQQAKQETVTAPEPVTPPEVEMEPELDGGARPLPVQNRSDRKKKQANNA